MEKINHFKSILLSFDTKFYKKIIKQSFLRTISYLLLLLLLISIPLTIRASKNYNQLTRKLLVWIDNQVPEELPNILPGPIKIENGIFSTEIKQPHIYTAKFDYVFIIDTTGKITSLTDYKNGILVLKDRVIFKETKDSGVEVKEQKLDNIKSFYVEPGAVEKGEFLKIKIGDLPYSLTSNNIKTFVGKFFIIFVIFAFLLLFSWQLIAKFFQILFFSLISLIINKVARTGLTYKELLNIGAYCAAPAGILAALVILLPFTLPLLPFIYLAVYVTYLILAILQFQRV